MAIKKERHSNFWKWALASAGLLFLVVVAVLIPSPSQNRPSQLRIMNAEIWSEGLMNEFEAIAREWGNQNNVEVLIEVVPLEDLDAKTTGFIESGSGADLIVTYAHKIPIYSQKLLDFTDIASETVRPFSGYYETARHMTTKDERYYGLPLYSWSHLWVYNGEALSELGLQPANTYQEALTIAQKLAANAPRVYPFGIGLGRDDDCAMFLQATLWAFGGSVVDGHGNVVIDSPEAERAYEYVLALWNEGLIPPGAFGWQGITNNRNFLAKRIAFTMNSPTILLAAQKEMPEFAKSILLTTYPEGPAGRFSYATGFAFTALRSTSKRDLLANFLKFFYQPSNYRRLITAGRGAVNPWLRGCEDLEPFQDPRLQSCLHSLEIERHVGWPGPVTAAAAEVFQRRILANVLNDVVNNALTLKQALAKARADVEEIYAQHAIAP